MLKNRVNLLATAGFVVAITATMLPAAEASTYVCKDAKGKATFSDRPCGDDAREMEIRETNVTKMPTESELQQQRVSGQYALSDPSRPSRRSSGRKDTFKEEQCRTQSTLHGFLTDPTFIVPTTDGGTGETEKQERIMRDMKNWIDSNCR